MKSWKCFDCGDEKETDDNITIYICKRCMKEMEIIDKKKRIKNGSKDI